MVVLKSLPIIDDNKTPPFKIILSLYYFVGGMFASNVDWFMQHCVFPDEFRKLFYKTGNFFPSFNANLGSGQNIYYMSYYGLFSPIYLFSYLFPSVSMIDYIIFTSIISIVVTILLVYRWLIMNKFGVVMSFAMAVMYVLAAPVIYHSYTQIMTEDRKSKKVLFIIETKKVKYFGINKK